MVDIKDKITYIRALILGLVVTLSSSFVSSFLAGLPVVGKVITFNTILGSSIVVGLLAVATLLAMDNIKMLQE